MKVILVLVSVLIASAYANCGCLKCSPHLKVVSGPSCPMQLIYRDGGDCHCPKTIPYIVQEPVVPPPAPYVPKHYDYQMEFLPQQPNQCLYSYDYTVQTPLAPPPPPAPLVGLRTCTDRLVMDRPGCRMQYAPTKPLPLPPAVPDCLQSLYLLKAPPAVAPPPPRCMSGPIIEPYVPRSCGCRYENSSYKKIWGGCNCKCRRKRSLTRQKRNLIDHTVKFFIGLLPNFIKNPIKQTIKNVKRQKQVIERQTHRKQIEQTRNKIKINPIKSNSPNYYKLHHSLNHKNDLPHYTVVQKYLKGTKRELPLSLKQNFVKNERYGNERTIIKPNLNSHNINRSKAKVSKQALLEKLQSMNDENIRKKRAILLNSGEISMPFFEIADEDLDEQLSNENNSEYDSNEENYVGSKYKRRIRRRDSEEDLVQSSNIIDKNPLLLFLKLPLRFLHNFHTINKQFAPVLRTVPKVIMSSKNYVKDFGRNLHTNVLNLASNVIGDFDVTPKNYWQSLLKPSRYRRSLEGFKNSRISDNGTSRIINAMNENSSRKKRYILKVVDEDEVQQFLSEKLGGYFDDSHIVRHKHEQREDSTKEQDSREAAKDTKKKFVVKKLSPKIIIDKKGRTFLEINGNKRPLFLNKRREQSSQMVEKETPTEDISKESSSKENGLQEKISDLIAKAKERIDNGEPILQSSACEMPVQTIKEKINQVSREIQDLVNLDFRDYEKLYDSMFRLEELKKSVTNYWKNVMVNEKYNDINCKIRILDHFKDLQSEKDKATVQIAILLKCQNNFITKKLIKMLVRLQKLQCVIQKVVDEFEGKINSGTVFDIEKEIKYVDYLSSLCFVIGRNRDALESDLNNQKDEALQKEIELLEKLRKLLESGDSDMINEEAKYLWEIRNVEKLQSEAILEMNEKIESNLKIRKELKILFDLLKQKELSEQKQDKLLKKLNGKIVSKFDNRQLYKKEKKELPKFIHTPKKTTLNTRSHILHLLHNEEKKKIKTPKSPRLSDL